MDPKELQNQLKYFRLIATIVIGLVIFSTVFFHYVEHWSYLNSYYFTVVTMATVGYGDFTPHTDVGKVAATLLILVGIGLFGIFANLLLKRQALKRYDRKEAKQKSQQEK